MKVSLFSAWYDLWIGAFWDKKKLILYLCFLGLVAKIEKRMLRCYGCGLPYRDFPLDVVIPDEQWKIIGPTGHDGGILCAACIVERGKRLIPGATVVRAVFE